MTTTMIGPFKEEESNYIIREINSLIGYDFNINDYIENLITTQPNGWRDEIEGILSKQEASITDLLNKDYHIEIPTTPSYNRFGKYFSMLGSGMLRPSQETLEYKYKMSLQEVINYCEDFYKYNSVIHTLTVQPPDTINEDIIRDMNSITSTRGMLLSREGTLNGD